MLLRSLRPENIIDVLNWCHAYESWTPFPVGGFFPRYGIAIYQLNQAMAWSNPLACASVNRYESLAASMLNFLIVSEDLDLRLEQKLDPDVLKSDFKEMDWTRLFYLITLGQQHVFYHHVVKYNKSQRAKSRFDNAVLSATIAEIATRLIQAIPVNERESAIENASSIMVGKI